MTTATKLADKSLKTIEMLDTTHEQWGIMNSYETKVEMMNVRVRETCPDCGGKKYLYGGAIEKDGRRTTVGRVFRELLDAGEIAPPADVLEAQAAHDAERSYGDYSYPDGKDCWDRYTPVGTWAREWKGLGSNGMAMRDQSGAGYMAFGWEWVPRTNFGSIPCLTCTSSRPTRHYGYQPTGLIWVRKDIEVNVKYPRWPHGTGFNSRFHRHDCEICGKNGIKTGSIPIIAVREDKSVEGMFVGNACIHKMGHAKIKTIAQQVEKDPKSRPTIYARSYETFDAEVVVE